MDVAYNKTFALSVAVFSHALKFSVCDKAATENLESVLTVGLQARRAVTHQQPFGRYGDETLHIVGALVLLHRSCSLPGCFLGQSPV